VKRPDGEAKAILPSQGRSQPGLPEAEVGPEWVDETLLGSSPAVRPRVQTLWDRALPLILPVTLPVNRQGFRHCHRHPRRSCSLREKIA
jgi:hypothetical protein